MQGNPCIKVFLNETVARDIVMWGLEFLLLNCLRKEAILIPRDLPIDLAIDNIYTRPIFAMITLACDVMHCHFVASLGY